MQFLSERLSLNLKSLLLYPNEFGGFGPLGFTFP